MDASLHCSSSSQQIVFHSNQAKQKQNLIILDIDKTIMESIEGIHEAIPMQFRNNAERFPFSQIYDKSLDLHLLLIVCIFGRMQTTKYSIVFRKHFFDFLGYIHSDQLADLALYTRGRPDYAQQITLGITECYKTKHPNHNISDSLVVHIHSAYLHATHHAQKRHRYSKW